MDKISYRFSVSNKSNNIIFHTGIFTTHRIFTEKEQFDFFQEFSHNMYLNRLSFLDIRIWRIIS